MKLPRVKCPFCGKECRGSYHEVDFDEEVKE